MRSSRPANQPRPVPATSPSPGSRPILIPPRPLAQENRILKADVRRLGASLQWQERVTSSTSRCADCGSLFLDDQSECPTGSGADVAAATHMAVEDTAVADETGTDPDREGALAVDEPSGDGRPLHRLTARCPPCCGVRHRPDHAWWEHQRQLKRSKLFTLSTPRVFIAPVAPGGVHTSYSAAT